MDFNPQKVGEIIKTENKFIQTLGGLTEEFQILPKNI